MTTKRKRLLLEKRNRLKPIDETQLKGLHTLRGQTSPEGLDEEADNDKLDLLSPSRPLILPPVD